MSQSVETLDTESPETEIESGEATTRSVVGRAKDKAEQGYVMATSALLLVPMLIFAAFATDVGAWYVRGQDIQRAADAAALAGVVWMPNDVEAATAALQTVRLNGYPTAVVVDAATFNNTADDPDPTPQVLLSSSGPQQLRVDIKAEGEVFFGSLVIDGIAIERYGTAEYTFPVPMGNPGNALGTGAETDYGRVDNFYLREMPRCELRQNGDFIGAARSVSVCEPTTSGEPNPQHDPDGHAFIAEIPDVSAGGWEIQARATCWARNGTTRGAEADAPLRFRLYDTDATPLDDYDNENVPPMAELLINHPNGNQTGSFDETACGNPTTWTRTGGDPGTWETIDTVFNAGRYVIRSKNVYNDLDPDGAGPLSPPTNVRRGLFSLRIVPAGTGNGNYACSRVGPTAVATCPAVYGRDFVTTYTNETMLPPSGGGANSAVLSLAEIGPEHAGKQIEIILFDPADGLDEMFVLEPDGTAATIRWRTIDTEFYNYRTSRTDYTDGSGGPVPEQTCGTESCITQNSYGNGTSYGFQDRTLRIIVDIPTDYDTNGCVDVPGEPLDCWWEVRYDDSNGSINETLTWSVQVIGDPVRLID